MKDEITIWEFTMIWDMFNNIKPDKAPIDVVYMADQLLAQALELDEF